MKSAAFVLGLLLAMFLALCAAALYADDSTCPGLLLASGIVSSADHETAEGYFTVNAAVVLVKPEGIPYKHLVQARGRVHELVIRPVSCHGDLERLDR